MGKQEARKTLAVLDCGGPPPLSPLHSRDPKRQKAGAFQNLAAVWTIGGDRLVAASLPAWFPFACGFMANRVEY